MTLKHLYSIIVFLLISSSSFSFDGMPKDLKDENKKPCIKLDFLENDICIEAHTKKGQKLLEESIPYVSNIKIQNKKITPKTKKISFTITKKQASYFANEITKTYLISELEKDAAGNIHLPVYGLYHDHLNEVRIAIDTPTLQYKEYIQTKAPSSDSSYANIETQRLISNLSEKPSFDFFLLKSSQSGAGIMDIDGEIRWNYPVPQTGWANVFEDDRFFMLGYDSLYEVSLDLKVQKKPLRSEHYSDITIHHGLTKGKRGLLVSASATRLIDGASLSQVIVLEVDQSGKAFRTWDVGQIIGDYMRSKGDNPDNFVRDGFDWFHMNSVIYTNEEDNSIIFSSRENFIMKVDYETNEIKWIYGDKNKYWHSFPSLAELAITTDDIYPVGQHALSIVKNDSSKLMMYNNGTPSGKHPPGTPEGISYPTSSAVVYHIDDETREAKLTWRYDLGFKSSHRSSAYSSSDGLYTLIMSAHTQDLEIIDQRSGIKSLLKVKFSPDHEFFDLWNSTILEDF